MFGRIEIKIYDHAADILSLDADAGGIVAIAKLQQAANPFVLRKCPLVVRRRLNRDDRRKSPRIQVAAEHFFQRRLLVTIIDEVTIVLGPAIKALVVFRSGMLKCGKFTTSSNPPCGLANVN